MKIDAQKIDRALEDPFDIRRERRKESWGRICSPNGVVRKRRRRRVRGDVPNPTHIRLSCHDLGRLPRDA